MTSRVKQFEAGWQAACEHAGLGVTHTGTARWGGGTTKTVSLPTLTGPAEQTAAPHGYRWPLRPAEGGTYGQIDLAGEALEAELGVYSIQAQRGDTASAGHLVVHFAPPFPALIPWQVPDRWSLDCALGVRADGESFGVTLGHTPHLLAGGTTGSGKSVLARSLIATAACLEGVELWGLDPKYAELAQWARRFSDIASTLEEIADLLARAAAEKDRRMRAIAAEGCVDLDGVCAGRGVDWCEDLPWVVLVIDELAMPMADKTCRPLLFELAQQARAAGIQLVSMTQSPIVTVVPTEYRINHTARWAGLCNGPKEVEVVLGSSDAAKRAPAWMLPAESGEAYWRSGRGNVVHHVRGRFLDPEDIPRVVDATMGERPCPSLPGCGPIASGPDVTGAERSVRVDQGPDVADGFVEAVAARVVELFDERARSGGIATADTPTPIRRTRRKAPAGFPAPDRSGRAAGHRVAAWELHGDHPDCVDCGVVLDWADDLRVDPDTLECRCRTCMGIHKGAA